MGRNHLPPKVTTQVTVMPAGTAGGLSEVMAITSDKSARPRVGLRPPGEGCLDQESLASSTILVTWMAAVSAVILGGLALLVRWPALWPDARILARRPHAPATCRT